MTSPQPNFLPPRAPPGAPALERARGVARITIRTDREITRLGNVYQAGAAKVRFPRSATGAPLEAVLINTAGGLTGGDHLSYSITIDAGARGIATTQAAERIYRRSAGVAHIETRLTVAAGASLDWLPQETILFDRSALTRTLQADVDPSASLLAAEAIVLGRTAMGETAKSIGLSDAWRIRRGGELVFADGLRIDGDAVAVMASGATGSGAAALATVVLVAPQAEGKVDAAREALGSTTGEAGVSAWNGMLVARLIAPAGQALRAGVIRLIEALRGRPMPRVWSC